jgi:hexulose-6-phosphate isomerase
MNPSAQRIGFMQGRLSPMVNGMIQAFPDMHWRDEFATAADLGFSRMEWTLDHAQLAQNPFFTEAGREEIRGLSHRYGVAVSSITGDCFMQAPFWKTSGPARDALIDTAGDVIRHGARVGARIVVVPLVDNGSIDNANDEEALFDGVRALAPILTANRCRIAFESDFAPDRLAALIARFPDTLCGVNFDIGNSASLGWDPNTEIPTLGARIINVHVKDRLAGGGTVPLGHGAADFAAVFHHLGVIGYGGFLILQTARATDSDHAGTAAKYRQMTLDWLEAS